jgi:hypothetical protein
MSNANQIDPDLHRFAPLVWPAYLVAAMMALIPVAEFATSILPMSPSDIRWRFGAVGLFSGVIVSSIFGIFLAMVVATLARHRLALRIMSVFAGLSAVIVVVISVMFILDLLQLRVGVTPDLLRSYTVASARALGKLGAGAVVGLVLCIGGLRVSRLLPGRGRATSERTTTASPLVAGSRSR